MKVEPPPVQENLRSDESSSSMPVAAEVPPVRHFKVENAPVTPWVHFFAGGVAGMAGAIFTSPLDLVKTRLQSDFHSSLKIDHTGAKRGVMRSIGHHVGDTFSIIGTVYRQEGWRALFRGLGPNLTGVVPARSVNFFTYGLMKDVLADKFNDPTRQKPYVHLLAGISAGIVTSTVTNPIWLVKTRLQLDRQADPSQRMYRSSWDCVRKIVRTEGITALYRGLSASYLGTAESSLQWVLYERMRSAIQRHSAAGAAQAMGRQPSTWDKVTNWMATSGAAGGAKLLASLITYPHEVIRTRLRQAPTTADGRFKYTGLVQCFRVILREEGAASLYGGLTPHLLRTVPNSIIMFGTWDLIVRLVARNM